MVKKLKIFLNSLTATGHLNSTIGIGQMLARRGHDVVFVIDTSVRKHVESFGFRVLPLEIRTGRRLTDNPAKEFANLLLSNGFLGKKTSYEKTVLFAYRGYGATLTVMANHMIEFDEQIERYIEQESPDLFIYDQLYFFPCTVKHNIPWIKIISCQPACFLPDVGDFPPPLSGYSWQEKDKFEAFRKMLRETLTVSTPACQDQINQARNFVPTDGQYSASIHYVMSPYLNVYQYPEELDYTEIDPKYRVFRLDAFVRDEINETFQLVPELLPITPAEKLIFFSMGSMGGIDLDMMRRLIGILAQSPHRFIVSKGPLGDQLELAPNMWGKNSLPQTKILPIVDLVITHGGNNTVCEAFYFGKPMIVMALFADQFDNAQRLQDCGFGVRLEPYDVGRQELLDTIETVLGDTKLRQRLARATQRIRNNDKKLELCKKIEQLAYK